MSKNKFLLVVSLVLVMVLSMGTTAMATTESSTTLKQNEAVVNLTVDVPEIEVIQNLQDTELPKEIITELEKFQSLVSSTDSELVVGSNNETDIGPQAAPIPIGPYYIISFPWEHVFTNTAFSDYTIQLMAQDAYGWNKLYFIDTNGYKGALIGEPIVWYSINQNNPSIQISTPGIAYFRYQTDYHDKIIYRNSMITETDQILPGNTWYDDAYVILYSFTNNGTSLDVPLISNPTDLEYHYKCSWSAYDFDYLWPETFLSVQSRFPI